MQSMISKESFFIFLLEKVYVTYIGQVTVFALSKHPDIERQVPIIRLVRKVNSVVNTQQ